jgi:ATP-dependent Zn protease
MLSVEEAEPLHKVTIIPRGVAYLGATMQLPTKDRNMEGRMKLKGILAGYMGGRVAETLVFDLTAERNDLRQQLAAANDRAERAEVRVIAIRNKIRDELDKWRETCITEFLVSGPAMALPSFAELVLG